MIAVSVRSSTDTTPAAAVTGFPLKVQERSGELVHAWLAGGESDEALLDRLDEVYRESKPEGKE